MLLIQVILIIVFIFAIFKVIRRLQLSDISLINAIVWVFFWLAAGFVVIAPDTTFYLSRLFGITRGADFIVYISLVVLFFIVFRLMVSIEKLKKEITKLTREEALSEWRKAKSEIRNSK